MDDGFNAPSTSQPLALTTTGLPGLAVLTPADAATASFPLAILPPVHPDSEMPPGMYEHHTHTRSLHYHGHAEHLIHSHLALNQLWNRAHTGRHLPHATQQHHTPHHQATQLCTCGGASAGTDCSAACAASTAAEAGGDMLLSQPLHTRHGSSHGGSHSLQHLLATGSRQWGSNSWWDGRSMLKVKIYDFAVYADTTKAREVLRSSLPAAGALVARSGSGSCAGSGGSPTDLLVPPSSGVGLSLTIRASRNLPLPLLGAEFERILQRRHEKAGGRPDDPALRELLSYFSRERLPAHVVVGGGPGSGSEPAVRKGAAITFSRSSSGELVTEAGGALLGRVRSPALAEALFDLYLGEQPVSKKAKAAATTALLQLAEGGDSFRYRLQPGERLLCAPGASPTSQPSACVLAAP
ncbi:hypothetical protein HYH02_005112 [Chlamydomonas schloesseri]|uniref:Chalcone isomerase domain-containing protein n=1 Tax=Chlamydomonas schloesseri TaxID=2026947 RepID=A0A835WKV7_9CHLO|nr:hypothetical protein HYH02_005112 [Chlamydomonas schloesseri]|eukprot:KAG2449579.1 hypothetical protein HYH02_005112 [Chlamydomonas schloesseri]